MTSRPSQPDRQFETESQPLTVGLIELDEAVHSVTVQGEPITLSPQEFRLLSALVREADHVLSTEYLLDGLWGPDYAGDPGTLPVHILRLRNKLDRCPGTSAHIRTVRGIGYIFDTVPARPRP